MKRRGVTAAVRRASLGDFDIATVRNLLRGNPKRLRKAFSELREAVPADRFPSLIKAFYDNPFYKLQALGNIVPRSAEELKRLQPLNSAGYDIEAAWAASIICHYSGLLNSCIKSQDDIFVSVLGGQLSTVRDDLALLEKEFGVSFWAFSIRLLLNELVIGAEANSLLYKEIRKSGAINGFSYFLIFYMGFRCSAGASVQQIRERVPNSASSSSQFSDYIRYKLVPFDLENHISSEAFAEGVLRHETNSSISDLYRTFWRSLTYRVDARERPISLNTLYFAKLVHDNIERPYSRSLLCTIGENLPEIEFCAQTAKALDAYDAAFRNSMCLTAGHGISLLKAFGLFYSEGIAVNVVNSLEEIFNSKVARQSSALSVERWCTMLAEADASWGWAGIAQRLWRGGASLSIFGSLHALCATGLLLPDLAEFMPNRELATDFLDKLEKVYGRRISITLYKRLTENSSTTDATDDVTRFVQAIKSIRDCKYDDACALLSQVSSGACGPWLCKPRLFSEALLQAGRVAEAIDFIVAALLVDEEAWHSVAALETLAASLRQDGKFKKTLSYAILLHFAVVNGYEEYARYLAYAVEDVWEEKGVSAPSALSQSVMDTKNNDFVFYLHRLCTSEIMSESDQFLSVRELEEERIRVCQLLTEIDPNRAQQYLLRLNP